MFTSAASTLLLVLTVRANNLLDIHNSEKMNMLEVEYDMSFGSQLKLNREEIIANNKLMSWKYSEVDNGLRNPNYFNFTRHYFEYKNYIEKSNVYQFIRKMPKGAALHVHSSMMLGADYILTLTYEDYLYVCFANESIKLLFSPNIPSQPCTSTWTLMSDARNASGDVEDFDANLKKHFTLYTDDQKLWNSDINTVWNRFNKAYRAISSLLAYRPVREKYFYEALKEFHADNILYIELRSGLHKLYELNGTIHERMYLARLYQRVANKFIEDHPDFIGVKLILTQHRLHDIKLVRDAIDLVYELKNDMPDLYAGFDLVGQEDLGRPLADFLPILTKAKNDLDYYFHAGETNWYGTTSDENLIDAILLGAKRLGHAYALLKHPAWLEVVRNNDIALEINVVSNAVLSLVKDVRNHPLAVLLAMGLPIVLSSDDPGIWCARPLSHDFYIAFVGVASRRADLRTLKQLAINSLVYSALDVDKKAKAFQIFKHKWDQFVNHFNAVNT